MSALRSPFPALAGGGRVGEEQPLYSYLKDSILPREGVAQPHPVFELKSLDLVDSVFLCEELNSTATFICKFFGVRDSVPHNERSELMEFEYRSLRHIRSKGLDHPPNAVVKPLGRAEGLACLLAEEFVVGKNLDHYIFRAAHYGQDRLLLEKLSQLADFFAALHTATTRPLQPNFTRCCNTLRHNTNALLEVGLLDPVQLESLLHLYDEWEGMEQMWPSSSSLLHGDATPTNFIFDPDGGVTAIDLECSQLGDPMYDIGMLVAELKHHFALRIRCAGAAERFISHFLRRYHDACVPSGESFSQLTFRSRFYMAFGEIRISRNPWLPKAHQQWLIEEARRCLLR